MIINDITPETLKELAWCALLLTICIIAFFRFKKHMDKNNENN